MMISILNNLKPLPTNCLQYVFESMKLRKDKDSLWLEFGVFTGRTINYISQFTTDPVYGFDSFEGLPEKWRDGFEKGAFNVNGVLPGVRSNVVLIKGWFQDTLPMFIKEHVGHKKISFIHLDADLYSSTKYVLDQLKSYLDKNCIIVFDELINYPGFDGETGELKAFYEFITENEVEYEWIGYHGEPAAVMIKSVK